MPIDVMSVADLLEWLEERVRDRGAFAIVATMNVDVLSVARRDAEFHRLLTNVTALNTVDGAPVSWLMRRVGASGARAPGSDIASALACSRRPLPSLYLLGDEQATLDAIVEKAQAEKWDARLMGVYSPSREEVDDEVASRIIVDRINASGADVLLVGFGAPRQEKWMARWRDHLAPAVGISVGGALKFVAWPRRRAPRWMQIAGLEWLHRTLLEPTRLAPRYARNLIQLAALARLTRRA